MQTQVSSWKPHEEGREPTPTDRSLTCTVCRSSPSSRQNKEMLKNERKQAFPTDHWRRLFSEVVGSEVRELGVTSQGHWEETKVWTRGCYCP